ncbi:MAG: hypothetical protein HY262_04330 [Chloroflexi bacterium]|nr:hypothetical protein [Chloroflexota bacterium]
MSRLQDLGVLRVVGVLDNGYSFDLVDDIEDRREEMRVAAGQPSRMGELQASVARAEAATTLAEAGRRQVEADSARARERRSDLRALFAHRVGRWVLWFARIVLGTLYIGAVVLAGYFVSANLPVAIVVAVIGVSVVLAALDWLLHIDGFALAATLESRTVKGLVLWLESFDPE